MTMITNKKLLLPLWLWLLVLSATASPNPPLELKRGMLITTSVQVKKAFYPINGYDSLNRPVIMISGNNITVDFDNAVLMGSNDKELPNQFYGLAIFIKGDNITLKNAKVCGFKVAVIAEGCRNLRIEFCNFSYNYRQHLQSNWLREDVSDWMSYHHNENDEWLRYGAGIYLKDCTGAGINNNVITGGQCALMMMRSNEGLIYDNDFSFNSAIGIGLYRSSRNKILHNKLDFNVRGYSHGFYNRGQDSAGILVFEQCTENVIAYNSVTHGGDGFFLWAGQTTMDNGQGGCNDNYLYKNDFSYAPTNGVEVTFSKNTIRDNIIKECDNGIWGGYSWNTSITGNTFYKNKTGIAIEHGQHINISNNSFEQDKQDGIKLWARKQQPADWGYAQKRDTKSHDYNIWGNSFTNENNALNFSLTDNITILKSRYTNNKADIKKDSSVTRLEMNTDFVSDTDEIVPRIINTWKDKTIPPLSVPSGKDQIRITEWGPYDHKYPLLFLKNIDSNGLYHFDVLGPKGNWKIKDSKDLTALSAVEGVFPATITAQKNGTDVQLSAEYVGEECISQFGKVQTAGQPVPFSFRDFRPDINWTVNWYSWDAAHDPNKNYEQFTTVFRNNPVKTETTKKIDYTWWGAIGKNLPADSFVTVAVGTVEVKKGRYNIGVTADDLVKVFIDGKLVIDFWDAAKYKYDEDAHHDAVVTLNGKHQIRIEQVENSGYATLIFNLTPL